MNNNVLYHQNLNSNGQAFPFVSTGGNESSPVIVNNINEQKRGIGITPTTVISGLIGGAAINGALTSSYLRKEDNRRMADVTRELKNKPKVEGNYYKQVENVANNLEIVFTPISAIITVKNGKNIFTLDTIETSEMNEGMKSAWKSKNSNYFKNILLGKMYSEMQIAEESFAKRFIKNHYAMKGTIEKKSYDTSYIERIERNECSNFMEKVASFYCDSDLKQKLAIANIKDIEKTIGEITINFNLDRPFDKYAGVIGDIKNCIGLKSDTTPKNIKKHLENPRYLMKNIEVGFFPDRVIYSMDNSLVSTLPLLSMNDEGYKHFINSDEKYFKNLFVEKTKENMKFACEENNVLYKEANEIIDESVNPVEVLQNSDSHPVAIYLFLIKHYGMGWLKFDISIIEHILKKEFNLTEINDSSLNKIMTIMALNQSDSIYENSYAFEKAVLSLCSKPVDFTVSEKDNILIQNIVFAIDTMDRVTLHDDIYDNFSSEVVDYIVNILANSGMYIYNPSNIVSSPLEPQFKETINEFLLKRMKSKMTILSNDKDLDNEIENNCEYIHDNANAVLNSIRRYENNLISGINIKDLIDKIIIKKSIREDLSTMIKKQVLTYLALDTALTIYNNNFEAQNAKYELS